jgi:hypothetical protein
MREFAAYTAPMEAWLPIFLEEPRPGGIKKNITVLIRLDVLAEKANLNFPQTLRAGLKHTPGIK